MRCLFALLLPLSCAPRPERPAIAISASALGKKGAILERHTFPVAALALAFQPRFLSGLTAGGVKGWCPVEAPVRPINASKRGPVESE